MQQKNSPYKQGARILIVVPTYELAQQVDTHVKQLAMLCKEDCTSFFLGDLPKESKQHGSAKNAAKQNNFRAAKLEQQPNIVIGTPDQILASLSKKVFPRSIRLQIVVGNYCQGNVKSIGH